MSAFTDEVRKHSKHSGFTSEVGLFECLQCKMCASKLRGGGIVYSTYDTRRNYTKFVLPNQDAVKTVPPFHNYSGHILDEEGEVVAVYQEGVRLL
jgi:hypothetical protein